MNGVLVDRELLKEAKLIAECFASSRHAAASVQKNPAVAAALLEEMERAERLEGKLRAALALPAQAAADAAGLQRSTTTRQVGALTLTAVPCLKDPETGEMFFTPDVTAVLVSLAGALEVQG